MAEPSWVPAEPNLRGTASFLAPFDSTANVKRSRESYTREFKLTLVN